MTLLFKNTLELCGEGTGMEIERELGEHCHVQPEVLFQTRLWRREEDFDAHTSGSGLQGQGEPAGDTAVRICTE